jgi:hypothetical protein
LGPQIANPLSVIFAEGPRILQIIEVRKFGDLRLAEFICGPPTFEKQGALRLLDEENTAQEENIYNSTVGQCSKLSEQLFSTFSTRSLGPSLGRIPL